MNKSVLSGLVAAVLVMGDGAMGEGRKPPALGKELMARVSAERLRRDVDTLAAFGTRHTLSDTESETRGIGAARRWILSEFEALKSVNAGVTAELEFFTQAPGPRVPREVEMANVVVRIPGTMGESSGRLYYVIGHYDSRASEPLDAVADAPGANDDASGTAVAMEIARVIAAHPLESTVVCMATVGEEQGLLGATYHAQTARAKGLNVCGVLSNDIVGDPSGAPGGARYDRQIRVFSEGVPRNPSAQQLARIRMLAAESDSSSRQLARYIREVAEAEGTTVKPWVIFRPDRFLRGGDHSPFNNEGYAAVRFTVVHELYDRQHQDVRTEDGRAYGDLPEFVDEGYLADVTRLNLAALVHMANAPSGPGRVRVLTAELMNDTAVRWEASPEPDVAGYEVVWRETTSAFWEEEVDVGLATEHTVPLSKDNYFFGVRAYDKDGYRSPVVFAVDGKE